MRGWRIFLFLAILLGAGFFGTWTLLSSPHWALYQIGKAIYQRDPRLFLAYVDVDQIIRSQKEAIIEELVPDRSQSEGRKWASNLLAVFMGPVSDMVKDRLARVVADPKRDNLPSAWALVLAAKVTRNGDHALVLLADPEEKRRLRLSLRHDPGHGNWRVVEVNPADLKRLLQEYLKEKFPRNKTMPETAGASPAPPR